jgi:predicted TIM-barrel fold metal-dependent hydrolase
MRNGIAIIDADAHAIDLDETYRKRLPKEFRDRMVIYPSDGFDRLQNGALAARRPKTAEQNLADNDREGIDIQVLYPTGGLFLSRVRERDYSIALARTYNDWLYEWCSVDPKRLKAVALVPLHVDVKAAIVEMERAVGELGMVGVMVNTFDRSRNVAHKDFWPFYEECNRQSIPVSFHASGSDTLDSVCYFDNFLSVHTLSHVPEQLVACTAVIYSGLLEVFPDLRVAFLETGCGWVPFWMEHMDEEWEKRKLMPRVLPPNRPSL